MILATQDPILVMNCVCPLVYLRYYTPIGFALRFTNTSFEYRLDTANDLVLLL